MSHIDEGLLHAYLDGAIRPGDDTHAGLTGHLDHCADCRARLEDALDVKERAAAVVRAAEPHVAWRQDFDEVLIRSRGAAGVGEPAARRPAAEPARRSRRLVSVAWAASLMAALGSGWMARAMIQVRSAGPEAAPATQAAVESLSAGTDPVAAAPAAGDDAAGGAAGVASLRGAGPGTTHAADREPARDGGRAATRSAEHALASVAATDAERPADAAADTPLALAAPDVAGQRPAGQEPATERRDAPVEPDLPRVRQTAPSLPQQGTTLSVARLDQPAVQARRPTEVSGPVGGVRNELALPAPRDTVSGAEPGRGVAPDPGRTGGALPPGRSTGPVREAGTTPPRVGAADRFVPGAQAGRGGLLSRMFGGGASDRSGARWRASTLRDVERRYRHELAHLPGLGLSGIWTAEEAGVVTVRIEQRTEDDVVLTLLQWHDPVTSRLRSQDTAYAVVVRTTERSDGTAVVFADLNDGTHVSLQAALPVAELIALVDRLRPLVDRD